MTAIELACRQCASQPYELCINADGSRANYTHPQRIEDASAISDPNGEDPELVKQAIDAAVGDLI